MESGLDWGLGDSRISPTWDFPAMSAASLEANIGRNLQWGLANSDFARSSAWGVNSSSSLISRGHSDPSSALVGSRSNEIANSDLWKTGNWNHMDDRSNSGGRSNTLGTPGWGKVPVCQGSSWDASSGASVKESVRMVREPDLGLSNSNGGSSDGTDIWRMNLSKPDVNLSAVGSAPGVMRGIPAINDNMSWIGRDVHSIMMDGQRQNFPSTPLMAPNGKPSWDSSVSNTWSNMVTEGVSLPGIGNGQQNSNSRVFTMRQQSPLMAGAWNTTELPEADFGHWSQSSAAAVSTPAQQKVDNGTAVWGAPPVMSESLNSTRAAVEPPQQPANVLPFSIDFSVPPPPVIKMSSAPTAQGPQQNFWNPSMVAAKSVGTWSNASGGAFDWSDSNLNRKGNGVKLHTQPQMRSRLLQQLMDAGYRKEDAQNAIIRNDMNYERAMADLMSNSVRINPPTQDFQTVLGDASNRHSLQGMDSSFNLMVSVPSNVYPPIVPSSLPRDVQTKAINNMHALNEARVNELQSKEHHLLQQKLLNLLLQVIQSGAWSPNLLPLITKQLAPAQIIILQQIVELQTVLTRLQETRALTPPGEQRDRLELLIANIQSEIGNRQLSMTDKKPPSNGSSPVDAGFLGQLQALGLKNNEMKSTDSHPPSSTASLSPDFLCQMPVSTWSSINTSAASDFSNAGSLVSSCASPTSLVNSMSAQSQVDSSLHIKEFIPGKPWADKAAAAAAAAGKALSDHWKAPGWGTTDAGSGLRRGSLTMSRRLDGSSSLSSSDWSLDMISGTSGSSSGLKSDLTLSVPTVWSPVEGRSSSSLSPAGAYQSMLIKSSYSSSSSESGSKSGGNDNGKDNGAGCSDDQSDNLALKMLCNGWGDGSYEHGWSVGDDFVNSALLPVDLLTDQ